MATDGSAGSGRSDVSLQYISPDDEHIFSSLLDTLEEPFFLLDNALRIHWHNKACDHLYYEVSGRHLDIGFDITVLLTPEQRSEFRGHLDMLSEGKDVHFQWKYQKKAIKWLSVSLYSFRSADGAFEGLCGSLRDITEEKKIRRELEVLSLVAKETNNGVVIFDRLSYRTLWVNEGFTRLTGYAADEIIGRNPAVILKGPDIDWEQLRVWSDRIAGNLPYSGDLIIYRKDGPKKILHITGQPFKSEHGDVSRYFAIGYDVTDQRRMEEERLQYEIGLQKNITRVILETQELERNLLGRELHDNINQLLAAVRLQLSYSLKNFSGCRPVLVQCRENIIEAIDEVRRLAHRMVMPRFSERTLPEMLENLVDNYQYDQVIRLDTSRWKDETVPVPVKEVFFRVVQEQLSNIYKHARATRVTIHVTSRDDGAALAVEDNGIGFFPDEKTGGIGLSNIRSRVESHDGEFRITSAPGQGCVLLVDIPLE